MTDTRKEFERAVSNLGWSFDYIGDGQYGSHTIQFANKLWQACQSLNDKRIENYKSAYETWQDKTEWVQETSTAKELGLHRADVLKKRIDQLLAVIKAKDEALIKACELIEKFSLQVYNGSDCLRVYDAVELQPADVELVEVGVVCFEDTLVGVDLTNTSVQNGDKCYTIKTKASTK